MRLMSEIEKINLDLQFSNIYSSRLQSKNRNQTDKEEQASEVKKDKFIRNKKTENEFIYNKPLQVDNKTKVENKLSEELNTIQRPINIDESNNIFYINYEGENKAVKIEPGEYSLTELSSEIQTKVNENFGIGKLKLDLTASGSDRLIKAQDKSIFDFLDKK
jgi:hypothetical protein